MKIRIFKLASYEKTCRLFAIFCLLLFLGTSVFAEPHEIEGLFDTGTSGTSGSHGKETYVGCPISASNGAYFFSKLLFSLGGPMDFRADLFYRSSHGGGFPFPRGFLLNLFSFADTSLINGTLYATVWFGTGDQVAFKKDASGNWILTGPTENLGGFTFVDQRPQRKYVFKETTNYAYLFDPIDERVYLFQKYQDFGSGQWIARIVRIMDRNGNQLIYTYPSATADNPSRIEDGLGRFLNLVYTQVGSSTFLSTITDQGARQIQFNYEGSGTDNGNDVTLRSVTDAMSNVTTFQYAGRMMFFNNLIASQKLPEGNTPYTQMYGVNDFYAGTDFFPRVTRQTDAYGNQTTLSYDGTNHILDVTYPDSTTEKYKHHSTHGFPEYITDGATKTATFTRNADEEHITSLTDRMGDATNFTYHTETGKLVSLTNAKGATINYTYAPQNQSFTNPLFPSENVTCTFYNLTRIDYPDETNEQFEYDDLKGNVMTRIDRAGKTRTYTYNNRGQVLTVTNPTSGVITYTYNSTDGTLASRQDSDNGITTFGHDSCKRLNRVTYPDGKFIQTTYNLNDQIISVTDENGRTYNYQYDANGNLIRVTDPKGNFTQFVYNDMDRVDQITDRLGKVTTFDYDSRNRVSSVEDPNGIETAFGYNSRGWMNSLTQGGQVWQRGYDDEGIVTSRTTPLNHTTSYQKDKLGFLSEVTNPLEQKTTLTRDLMSRITGVTDPLSRTTTFAYDSSGLLSSVTMPVIGTATYQRNDLGFLSQITDLNGQNWTFGYTPMGRLSSSTDPLSNTLTHTYDNRGRVSQTAYPDSTNLTSTFDDAGNVIRMLYSGGPDLQFTYDELDGLKSADGITFERDQKGRITATENPGTVFGATYDDGGRLKTVTYNNNLFTITYTYNSATGLLSRVMDSLTGAQIDFTYDNDRRFTGINRSNGLNNTFTWDNASRLIRFQDGPSAGSGLIDLQYALNGAGEVTQANITVPLDPASLLQSGTENFTYDAASRVSTAGYSHDQRGRMTGAPGYTFNWDGASRLTGINGTTLAYNGLGDLITRAESGKTIRYYYNYAIRLTPIVAEKDESAGQFLRYYVWTPGGGLLYMIDVQDGNKVYFYHFDRTGSTLALTDSNGTVTDKYAYEPYGELLGHQGSSTQPFTFVGRFGVLQEGSSGTLYHMRSRYYDVTTAGFISRDPVWPLISDPLQINPYQYVVRNPLSYSDPTGTQFEETVIEVGNLAKTQIVQEWAEKTVIEGFVAEQTVIEQGMAGRVLSEFGGATTQRLWGPGTKMDILEQNIKNNAKKRIAKQVTQKIVVKVGGRWVAVKVLGTVAAVLSGPVGWTIFIASAIYDGVEAHAEIELERIAEQEARLSLPTNLGTHRRILWEMGEELGLSDEELERFLEGLVADLGGRLEEHEQFERVGKELLWWIQFARIKPKPATPTNIDGEREMEKKVQKDPYDWINKAWGGLEEWRGFGR